MRPTRPDVTLKERMTLVAVVVFCLFAALFVRLWYLQVIYAPKAQGEAQNNAIRVIHVPAPRGQILDRQGRVIVGNRVSDTVTLDRRIVASNAKIVDRLAKL